MESKVINILEPSEYTTIALGDDLKSLENRLTDKNNELLIKVDDNYTELKSLTENYHAELYRMFEIFHDSAQNSLYEIIKAHNELRRQHEILEQQHDELIKRHEKLVIILEVVGFSVALIKIALALL